ncbi:MAG: hypothetical protein JNK67_00510 [Alphaproteobacteria bacterium]|nr:hypothetical protein [Alphaproteobacteria bacterium]
MAIRSLIAVVALFVGVADAAAERPSWAGQGQGKGHGKSWAARDGAAGKARREPAPSVAVSVHFEDRDRALVRDYYAALGSGGRCPPGLAKKGNGCLPPGQAKKWRLGRPLPPSLVFHAVPPQLLVELRPLPAGHRYVRVAGDILMIAIGTSIVVDAIADLGGL